VSFIDLFSLGFMQRALIAALLTGLAAPAIGTFIVQRRLALLGDGIGHVAVTGVALGLLTGTSPTWTAVVVAVLGAVLMELIRERGHTNGDVALALLFYGGIAGGVLLISLAGGTNANLMAYLFGSISTVTTADLALTVVLALVVLAIGVGLRGALFAVCHDEEFARAAGLPVRLLNIAIAVVAALTVTVAMRVVGLLLVSALMIVPVAVAQLVASSFRRTMTLAMLIGVTVCLAGLSITYWRDLSPGATIVVLAIGVYAVVAAVRPLVRRRRPHDPHPQLPDDVRVAA
jgi:zinc transport system permease protein